MVKFNFVKMSLENKNKISLGIITIAMIILIVLCITGFSFRNIRHDEQEHFFSNIKKWINGGDDDDVSPSNSNMIIPPHTPIVKSPSVEPIPTEPIPVEPIPTEPILDTTNILNNIQDTKSLDTKPSTKKDNLIDINKFNLQFFDANEKVEGDDYMYTGAEIGLTGANISCGPTNMKAIKASGVAILDRDGSISDIKILNNGKGYKLPPTIKITGGGGSGCKAKAVIDDDTKIVHFEILDGGNGYISTPSVIIEEPANNKLCKLYIKKN